MRDINEILSDDGVRETEILSDDNLEGAGEIEVNTMAESNEERLNDDRSELEFDTKQDCLSDVQDESLEKFHVEIESAPDGICDENSVEKENNLSRDELLSSSKCETSQDLIKEDIGSNTDYSSNKVGQENDCDSFVVLEKEKAGVDELAERKFNLAHQNIEEEQIGGYIVFQDQHGFWNNETWSATSHQRSIRSVARVSLMKVNPGMVLNRIKWEPRLLVIFSKPDLIFILKKISKAECNGPGMRRDMTPMLVDEVFDAASLKMRLSNLTTPTSLSSTQLRVPGKLQQMFLSDRNVGRREAFQLISPRQTFVLSVSEDLLGNETDSFLAQSSIEISIISSLCSAYSDGTGNLAQESYLQIVLGTIHSHVVVGNMKELETALLKIQEASGDSQNIVNLYDEDGMTALHYACCKRSLEGVKMLLSFSADVSLKTKAEEKSPCHLCAERLDDMSLSILFSSKNRPDPNALDKSGHTPVSTVDIFFTSFIDQHIVFSLDLDVCILCNGKICWRHKGPVGTWKSVDCARIMGW